MKIDEVQQPISSLKPEVSALFPRTVFHSHIKVWLKQRWKKRNCAVNKQCLELPKQTLATGKVRQAGDDKDELLKRIRTDHLRVWNLRNIGS